TTHSDVTTQATTATDATLTLRIGAAGFRSPRSNDTGPEDDRLSLTTISTPSHGAAVIGAGNQTIGYAPSAGYAGPDSITYTVSESGRATWTASHFTTSNSGPPARESTVTTR